MFYQNKQQKPPLGLMMEKNIIQSLQLAGVPLKTSAELDHQHKIDCLVKIANQLVGIQISLKQDWLKAKVAKICAMDHVSRFIYLTFSDSLFSQASKKNGHQLFQLLTYVIETYSQKAMCLCVGLNDWSLKTL